MKGDITGGVAIVREAMGSIPGGKGATLAGMIKHHISTLGKDKCAAEKKNGTKVHRTRAPPPHEDIRTRRATLAPCGRANLRCVDRASACLRAMHPSPAVAVVAQPRGHLHLHDAAQPQQGHGDLGGRLRRVRSLPQPVQLSAHPWPGPASPCARALPPPPCACSLSVAPTPAVKTLLPATPPSRGHGTHTHRSYEKVLKPYHGWMTQQVVAALPPRGCVPPTSASLAPTAQRCA